jgi:hypothetical protein
MATRGRPVMPIEQKRLKGTLRPSRVPSGVGLIGSVSPVEPPECPEWVSGSGQEFWPVAWATSWINPATDYVLVLMTAESLSERDTLRGLVLTEPQNFRARSSLRELDKQLISQLALLGFSPSDRARLGLSEIKKESKLEDLMRRKAERDSLRALDRASE